MSYLPQMDSFIALCFLKAPDPGRQDLYEEVGRENTILISTVEIDKTKPNDHLFTLLLTARSNQELCSFPMMTICPRWGAATQHFPATPPRQKNQR